MVGDTELHLLQRQEMVEQVILLLCLFLKVILEVKEHTHNQDIQAVAVEDLLQ